MHNNLCILIFHRIFASEKEINNQLKPKTRKGNKIMTREILNELVKTHKLNLDHYDKVKAWINPQYTFIYVSFGMHECVGGRAKMIEYTNFRLSIASILKKEKHFPEEYQTSIFGDFIWSIK